ncbi:hypothetical protein GCM10022252_19720 [Streptosporangium oxazolinicum]|uniref:Uncharacterized protein n=1 Tax=Streptosporangium oxazolinicum TaxID=909287 RepID=A0ABP8AP76_9ACTN
MADLETPDPNEHGWPFATGAGRVVTAENWETMASTWQLNGVRGMPGPEVPLAGNRGLYAVRLSNTQVEIQPGVAHIGGHFYELRYPRVFDLDITGTGFDGTNVRRDLLTLRLDRAESVFRFVQVKGGIGAGTMTLPAGGDELPLVQIDITGGVGLTGDPADRRWFLSRQVRPIKGPYGFLHPTPANGELGVDYHNNYLVVGANGLWVPASQVFNNDPNPATLDAIAKVAGLMPTAWTDVTFLLSSVTHANTTTAKVQVCKAGNVVHIRGGMVATTAGTALNTTVAKTDVISIPTGFRPDRAVYLTAVAFESDTPSTPTLAVRIATSGALQVFTPATLRSNILRVDFTGTYCLS